MSNADPYFGPFLASLSGNIIGPVATFLLTKQQINRLHAQNIDVQNFKTLTDRLSELEKRNDALDVRNDELSKENQTLRTLNLGITIELNGLKSEYKKLSEDFNGLRIQFDTVLSALQKLQEGQKKQNDF